MSIYDYCLKRVKEIENTHGLDHAQASIIYSELIRAVQGVSMNLGIALSELNRFTTEIARHNEAVKQAIEILNNSTSVEIKFKSKNGKAVTLTSQKENFVLFNTSTLIPMLSAIKYEDRRKSARNQSKQTIAIKCFQDVANSLYSIGMSKNSISTFVDDVLVEMGHTKISVQQIFKNLFNK